MGGERPMGMRQFLLYLRRFMIRIFSSSSSIARPQYVCSRYAIFLLFDFLLLYFI